jgi:hypothetical protein
MNKLLALLIALTLSFNVRSQTIKPVEKTVGKLHISIDPRMELLSVIQILSDYKIINRKTPYSNEIISYFSAFSTHDAVLLTNDLFKKGFSYDAPVGFMLHQSQVPELKQQVEYSDYLVNRADGKHNLDNYRKAIEQFAKESNFEKFWESHEDFYKNIIELSTNNIDNADLISKIEEYFNEKQNSYNIIICPSFKGNYGPRIPSKKDNFDIYSCISTTNATEKYPYVSNESIKYIVWHEFGHSFVNPQTEKFSYKVNSLSKLYDPIASDMSRMAYGTWSTCVNEHIIRAINIRLQLKYVSPQASASLINEELANRFIYISPLVNKLKEYEKQRDAKHITFSQFYPQLISVFDSLAKSDNSKLTEKKFLGPINAVSQNPKKAYIFPTNEKDSISLNNIKNYIADMFNHFKTEESILIPDTTALKTQLGDYGLMVYGTIESNLFLSHYKSILPFKIENNTLFADKEYTDEKIKFISCIPNPQNPKNGMTIYTGLTNNAIVKINSIFHGPTDYVVSVNFNKDWISNGYYDKTDTIWKFIK